MVEAKPAGFEADHRGCGSNSFWLNGELQSFQALDVRPAPEIEGWAHSCLPERTFFGKRVLAAAGRRLIDFGKPFHLESVFCLEGEIAMTGIQDRAAIARKITDWTRAVGNKDAHTVSQFVANDVVSFDLAPPLKHVGFDRKMMEDWFKTWKGEIGYEVTDQVIEVSDTLAVARSLDHMTGTKIDDKKVDVWTRSTVCFRKEDGDWKVMHVHASVPFYMDGSLKAAVDLTP
jgi:ketosteroid isomerase-like protein